jgi:hypothetical protein
LAELRAEPLVELRVALVELRAEPV